VAGGYFPINRLSVYLFLIFILLNIRKASACRITLVLYVTTIKSILYYFSLCSLHFQADYQKFVVWKTVSDMYAGDIEARGVGYFLGGAFNLGRKLV
jgi:hypothetical protein